MQCLSYKIKYLKIVTLFLHLFEKKNLRNPLFIGVSEILMVARKGLEPLTFGL